MLLWSFDFQYYVQNKHITIAKVNSVHRYTQVWDLKEATQKLIDARQCAVKQGNPAFGLVYKTLVNAFIGCQDDSRPSQIFAKDD